MAIGEYENWEICNFCGRDDDPVRAADPDFKGGANRESLDESQSRIGLACWPAGWRCEVDKLTAVNASTVTGIIIEGTFARSAMM
ncbi:CPCC family cysteine-rich protein [Sphingomonas faeni]|uniref:CPCC family cysteine-rich protein n=1 Tax=Sphingomonas faeni TaxID=185950 RepID=UPI00336504C1